jgi:uncharacterized protein YpmS
MIKKYWKRIMVYLIALDIVVFGIIAPIAGLMTWMSQG